MPTHKSAEKRLRQNEKRRQHNKARRSRVRTLMKQIRSDPGAKEAPELLKEVSSLLDRYAARELHHQNKADRIKSRLTRLVQEHR
ncbi:MAG: 30S ribosomal protein S20 [bacterium]